MHLFRPDHLQSNTAISKISSSCYVSWLTYETRGWVVAQGLQLLNEDRPQVLL